MRPMVKFTYHCNGLQPAPQIIGAQLLSQSILNLLNNAADASLDRIEIESSWNHHELLLEILDFGKGLSEETVQRAGQAFFTSKPGQGLGIGLFLANANIERFGGSVRLTNREEGGASTQVRLPLIKTTL